MNNFDQSSSGVNINLSCSYDCDLSRMYFEEWLIKLDNSDQYLYTGGGYLPNNWQKKYKFNKKDLLKKYNECISHSGSPQFSVSDEFSATMGFNINKATKQDLIDFIESGLGGQNELFEFCEFAGFEKNFKLYTAKGYHQGDYAEVVIPEYMYFDGLYKTIDRLCWDAPIYCRLVVNDEEYFVDQDLKGSYEWDKSEALEIVKNLIKNDFDGETKDYILSWCGEHLPNEPKYL